MWMLHRHVPPTKAFEYHIDPFMEMVFPDVCGLFQPCHKAKMFQEGFEEVLTWPPDSHKSQFNQASVGFPDKQV